MESGEVSWESRRVQYLGKSQGFTGFNIFMRRSMTLPPFRSPPTFHSLHLSLRREIPPPPLRLSSPFLSSLVPSTRLLSFLTKLGLYVISSRYISSITSYIFSHIPFPANPSLPLSLSPMIPSFFLSLHSTSISMTPTHLSSTPTPPQSLSFSFLY